jgi:hypothetical protein
MISDLETATLAYQHARDQIDEIVARNPGNILIQGDDKAALLNIAFLTLRLGPTVPIETKEGQDLMVKYVNLHNEAMMYFASE